MKTFREMLNYIHNVELEQSEWCREVHSAVKNLIGNDKMIVFDKPVNTYGQYGEFTQMAMCRGKILMCNSKIGWCDKPVQPYHGMFWHFMYIAEYIERGEYHLEDNPIKDRDCVVCV